MRIVSFPFNHIVCSYRIIYSNPVTRPLRTEVTFDDPRKKKKKLKCELKYKWGNLAFDLVSILIVPFLHSHVSWCQSEGKSHRAVMGRQRKVSLLLLRNAEVKL